MTPQGHDQEHDRRDSTDGTLWLAHETSISPPVPLAAVDCKKMWPRLLLACGATVFALLSAEVVLRVTDVEPEAGRPSSWRNMVHRPSRIPGLAYETVPLARGTKGRVHFQLNSLGMRDDEPKPRALSRYRVVLLGDSVAFGFGVENARDLFADRLERSLARRRAIEGIDVEVLNAGVGGYSTLDQALWSRARLPDLSPDMVVVAYYPNDPEIDPIQPLHAHFARQQRWWIGWELGRALLRARAGWEREAYGGGNYYRALHRNPRTWSTVEHGLDSIRTTATAVGAEVLVAALPLLADGLWRSGVYELADLQHQVVTAATARGCAAIDLASAFADQPPHHWRVSPGDLHPNARGHAQIAAALEGPVNEAIDRWRQRSAAAASLPVSGP